METGMGRLVGRGVACALVGVIVGLVGTVAHRAHLLGVDLPEGVGLGIVLALLTVLVAGTLARAGGGMAGLLGYGIGWVVVVQLLSLEGPGGDVLVPSEPVGYVWIYGGLLVVAAVAFLPRSWFSDRPVRPALHGRPTRHDGPEDTLASR
ncbi:hypothetical protein ACFWH7_21040 [Cellulosimicrobium cellulans]|uniref:hypothetical protein n=1 Tax=Cellulosimicrobium cellulans TaxID=1710 RepID=UPI0036475D74